MARKGAHCWAGAWPTRPHQPHPGHTGRGTPAARPSGRASGGGTAPDTRRGPQRCKAGPPGDGPPPPPRHAVPTGHASQRDSAGPPHPHTSANSTWVAEPDSPHRGRAARGGGAPGLRRPSQRRKVAPPGTPFSYPGNAQRLLARAHASGAGAGSPRAHQPHPGHTGRVPPAARPRGRAAGGATAPDTKRPSRRWKANPPEDGPHQPRGTQPPTGHASQVDSAGPPHPHTGAHSTRVAGPHSPPRGRAAGGEGAPCLRRPSQRREAPSPKTPFRDPPNAP